jgi:SAM-dependent methyltransferase
VPELDFFRCVRCGASAADAVEHRVRCRVCDATYRLEAGVPLLVTDWRAHEAELEAARQVNPGWYVAEQPAEAVSPWRHQLRKRRRYVEGVLRRALEADGRARFPRLLDLGCGDGNNLLWLRPFAEQLYGSDYNLVRLARARQRFADATLFLADILDYPARDGYFDAVFFNHVIEHIPEDERALATVARILRPGGLLVLGTPNEGAWWWQWAYRRAPEIRASTDHVHFYTAETISARVAAAGLRVEEVEHLGWGPPDWHWDGQLRRHKVLDDLFEALGRAFIPKQASSLYLIGRRTG